MSAEEKTDGSDRTNRTNRSYRSYWSYPPEKILSWLLFLALLLTSAYFFHEAAGWNVNSRISLTYAIVERGTFAITHYQKNVPELYTEDRAIFEGEYYSDKIIGTSLLGVPPMAVLHLISKATGREFSWNTKRYVVRTFSVSVLGALAGVVMFRLLMLLGASVGGALVLALAFFFGTQFFSITTIFVSYAPAVFFLLVSYSLLVRRRDDPRPGVLFGAGAALGAALLCEYTVGLAAVGLSLYALYHLPRKRRIAWYWLGAALPLTIFVAYTLAAFGEVAIPYKYLEREEFRAGMQRGFQGITGFRPRVLYFITIHPYRGLFYHSPVLLLAVWGWIAMWRRDPARRGDALLSIGIAAAYLAFNASYYMWWGGWTNGPRHLIPALPFLVTPLVWVWHPPVDEYPFGRIVLILTIGVSVFLNTIPAMVDAQIPQGYPSDFLYRPRPYIIYEDPLIENGILEFAKGHVAMNAGRLIGLSGLQSLLPLLVFWVAFRFAIGFAVRSRTKDPGSSNPC